MSADLMSEGIPVPFNIKKTFMELLLPNEDCSSIFDQLDYSVNTSAENSIWNEKKIKTTVKLNKVRNLDLFLPKLTQLNPLFYDQSDSSDESNNFEQILKKSSDNKVINPIEDNSPKVCSSDLNRRDKLIVKSFQKEYPRKRIRFNKNKPFHSEVLEENSFVIKEESDIGYSFNEFSDNPLSDEELCSEKHPFIETPFLEESVTYNKSKIKVEKNDETESQSSTDRLESTHIPIKLAVIDAPSIDKCSVGEDEFSRDEGNLFLQNEEDNYKYQMVLQETETDCSCFKRNLWQREFELFVKRERVSTGQQELDIKQERNHSFI